ncbi:dihydroneopterin aldolase [Sediminicurvatus halobius]|uniref:7,8-dihydroneopterin aldolase n=1 Tax=Sediminicurvatus halobius TaxID=2182432 RepID=A0A2U2N758_9GAMM|nr:dihydroneopterin aldolase [Spiribacter halobius]PWG64923.1 dihydroneopterin aldolase [Spiribacter halobius]UEX78221.1 dihydroneopterin aldolase [Spiribacter halobius]
MDTVFLKGLRIESVIGVHAWERAIRQRLELDLELAVDTAAAAGSDRLEDAVDYAALADTLQREAAAADCQLLEALAARLAAAVFAGHGGRWLRLTLNKPGAVPAARGVGVTIERTAPEHAEGS